MWGFLAVSWFLPWPSPRKQEETWAFPNCSPSVCQKNPRPTETNWGQLTARLWANCNHYTGHRKFLQIVEKYRHKRISHLTLKSLAWDHNKNVPKDSRDLSHCSTQHSTQGLMTEGVAVVILLLWVPPQPPSNRLSAALPNPGRGGKAQRGMFVARLSPISQNENNDWLFLWGSLEKISCHDWVGWGKNCRWDSSAMYNVGDIPPQRSEPQDSKDTWSKSPRKGHRWAKPFLPSVSETQSPPLGSCRKKSSRVELHP